MGQFKDYIKGQDNRQYIYIYYPLSSYLPEETNAKRIPNVIAVNRTTFPFIDFEFYDSYELIHDIEFCPSCWTTEIIRYQSKIIL